MNRGIGALVLVATVIGCGENTKDKGRADAAVTPEAGSALEAGQPGQDGPLAIPIDLGAGHSAAVAVDGAGVAHVAWVGPEATTTTLQFCRLPRGARTCDARGSIMAEGTSVTRPLVVLNAGAVHVLQFRYGLTGPDFSAVFLFTSSDGGRTFAAGRRVGTADFSAGTMGPDGTVSLTTHAVTAGLMYQAVPLGAVPAEQNQATLSTTHLYSGAVGLVDGTTPLVVFANGTGDARFRRYIGTGNRNAEVNWTAPMDIGKGDRMHLAGGSKGLFLLAQAGAGELQVRRYDGSTFGPGVAIPNGTGELAQAHLVQDGGGRLHVLWPRIEAAGVFLYHATSDDGQRWESRVVTSDQGFAGVRLALAPDRLGVATWATAVGGASSIHVLPIAAAP